MYASKTMLFCPKCGHVFNIVKDVDKRIVCPYCDVLILTDNTDEDEFEDEDDEFEDEDEYGYETYEDSILDIIKRRIKYFINSIVYHIKG